MRPRLAIRQYKFSITTIAGTYNRCRRFRGTG